MRRLHQASWISLRCIKTICFPRTNCWYFSLVFISLLSVHLWVFPARRLRKERRRREGDLVCTDVVHSVHWLEVTCSLSLTVTQIWSIWGFPWQTGLISCVFWFPSAVFICTTEVLLKLVDKGNGSWWLYQFKTRLYPHCCSSLDLQDLLHPVSLQSQQSCHGVIVAFSSDQNIIWASVSPSVTSLCCRGSRWPPVAPSLMRLCVAASGLVSSGWGFRNAADWTKVDELWCWAEQLCGFPAFSPKTLNWF